jgi:hypothetical protein
MGEKADAPLLPAYPLGIGVGQSHASFFVAFVCFVVKS